MDTKTKHSLTVLSKELNDLLNGIYESSKRYEKVSAKLILYNSIIFLWRKMQKVISLNGMFALILIGIPSWIIATTTDAFLHIINLPVSSMLLLILIGIILSGAFLRILVLNEMSTIGNDMFHLGVYEKRKKKEYSSLIKMAQEKDYILTLRNDLERELSKGTKELQAELVKFKEELKSKRELIEEKNEKIDEKNAAIEEKNEAIQVLLKELDLSEESAVFFKEKYNFMIAILYQLKSKLNLLVNDQFNLDNIDFGSSYTLYKVEKNGLVFVGAYGVNKAELRVFIPLEEGRDKYNLSINKTQSQPLILEDFISWKRTLQDGSKWILSLHLDDSNRHTLNSDDDIGKLNLTITQEVLWICCELLYKFAEENQGNRKGES